MADYLQHGRRHGPQGSDPILGMRPADYAGLSMFPSQTIAGSTNDAVAWTTFDTSSTSVFGTGAFSPVSSTPNNTTGDESLMLLAGGVYIIFAAVQWQVAAVTISARITVFRGETSKFQSQNGAALQEELTSNAPIVSADRVSNYSYVMTSVAPDDWGGVTLDVTNGDGSSQDITSAKLTAVYWPVSLDIASVY